MVLAGVLLKMGGYGLIRMNVEMFPNAHVYLAPALAVLGVVNIVYGALTAFSQGNLKRCLACSSISHMGFVLIGISALTEVGFSGAVLQMLSHGLIAAALFFLAGVTYERTHTLLIDKMGGIAKAMPVAFALFTAGTMASLALPGMSGFVSELTIFLGVASSPIYSAPFKVMITLLAAVGLILTPVYLLSMLRRVFYGESSLPEQADSWCEAIAPLMDAQPREVFIAVCMIVPIVAIGFYPKLATQTYDATTVAVASQLQDSITLMAQAQGNTAIAERMGGNPTALLGGYRPLVSTTTAPVIP
jgi:NAD(P)H-quinone oxidoreductase subunit 4